jgi:DnaK suppressor protein
MEPDRARELLSAERKRIERALADLRNEDDGELTTIDQHLGDEASTLYQNELDQSLVERLRDELEGVKRAERRLADGTYGLSVESGQPIPDERLEAFPTAERTAEEEARRERG